MADAEVSPHPVSAPGINAHAGIQVALTVLALAALPITAWLYIADYVEARVETAIERHDSSIQITLRRQQQELDNLQGYTRQLCSEARQKDREFSCQAQPNYGYPYRR